MQTYDILMLLVLVGTTMFGFWKGFAWQVASVASLVLSYFVALKFSPQLAPHFGSTPELNRFAAMLAIYIGTSFVIWMLFRMVAGAIDRVKLQEFDKQLGAMLGFAKGVLFCVVITFFAVTLVPSANLKEAVAFSKAGRYIVVLLDKTESVVPPEINQVIAPYIKRINQELDPSRQPYGSSPQIAWPGANPGGSAPSANPWPTAPNSDWSQPQAPATWPTQQPSNGFQSGSNQQGGGRY